MLSYYRYDDLDGGIIKHSTWYIDHIKNASPELRSKYGRMAAMAYLDMGEAWAGQGKNDEAIALMKRAQPELAEVPNVASMMQPEIDRLMLVGTPAAPLKAPRWLNVPAGQTELAMPGKVTLLEFSAHWCIPCKESYPGVNRLLEKYGPQGFRVVLATELYGYFEKEQNLSPDEEYARDKKYFAEHGMNVPIAIGDRTQTAMVDGKRVLQREPNDEAYRVGGIPQIHLIDKHGKIRLVMVGYDDANESKLAKMIEEMLKEK
jgi:thiol-disulfide isomerase/thioredoxin